MVEKNHLRLQKHWQRERRGAAPRAWRAILTCLVSALIFLPLTASAAGPIDDPNEVEWYSYRDLSDKDFSRKFAEMKKAGFRIIDVDYASGKYSMVWRKSDGRKWAEYRDMTSARYGQRWAEFKKKGYRPIDVDVYKKGIHWRWSGIWVENKEKLKWASFRGLTAKDFAKKLNQYKKNYLPVDVESYQTPKGMRYAVIWVENKPRHSWALHKSLSKDAFGKKWQEYSKKGLRLHDFESYREGRSQRYSGIWVQNKNKRLWKSNRDMTETGFANRWRTYRDLGYRLVDFERYKTSKGMRYAGIWRQNNNRPKWAHREDVDDLVAKYVKDNNIPGLSVAVIEGDKVVYRRGFGHADVGRSRVAHGETIYPAASVSKVVGASLALRLKDKSSKPFKLSDKTSKHIPGLPKHHTHSVSQLLTHTSCIRHYKNGKGKYSDPPSSQYKTQRDALKKMWKDKLICTPPRTNPSYSTHSFTFLGTVLEESTGKSLSDLLSREISKPLKLNTLRIQFPLTSNYDRAEVYALKDRDKAPHRTKNKNEKKSRSNTSWKALGGGLEISAVDLARFGHAVKKNRVVKKSTKDSMWTQKKGDYGYTWVVDDDDKYVEHGGSQRGSRTHLRVYKDKNLVIAIMSNRRDHDFGGDLAGLTTRIADAL